MAFPGTVAKALPHGLALGLLLLSAAPPAVAGKAKPVAKALGPLPASWVGDIPGASGAIRWQVDLEADGTFQLRQTYLNRDPGQNFDDIGRWRLESGGKRLVLQGGREAPVFLQPKRNGRRLRKLNLEGQRIRSGLNDRLTRMDPPEPIDPRLNLVGLFRYMADAPSIELCATGRTLPVAMEADYLPLERAYLQSKAAGAPRLVSIDGLITNRPSMEESQPPQRTVVVKTFAKLSDRQNCPSAEALPLRGTSWRLQSLEREDGPAPAPTSGRPVELLFDPDSDRVSGSGGCNRLMGGFELNGAKLRFSPLASTKMACPPALMDFEMRMFQALEQVRGWQIEAETLALLDAGGRTLLAFKAVPKADGQADSPAQTTR